MAEPWPKLNIPVKPREFLERPRLRSLFDAALARKVALVTAPAGYGKTVFLCEGLAHVNRPVAWLSLDKHDNNLLHFWKSLIMALDRTCPGLGDNARAMLRFGEPSIKLVMSELANEISKVVPDLIIVLDDYHEIDNQAIHDSLSYLVEYLPQVCLFIGTRVAPRLPLWRLRGRGHLAEIKPADLQFTREETYSFLNEVMKLGLAREQVDFIYDRTEGWIAGLQMVALSLRRCREAGEFMRAFKGANSDIMEYLTKEVLEQQEKAIQMFLLHTSILERLTESLCNAVTGRTDCQQIMEKLVAANLFLQPLDDEGQWFRYHQLFRDLLHKHLEATQPDILTVLHGRASTWFESQRLMEDAVEHAVAAQDFERAATLIHHVAFAVVGQDKYGMVQDWITKLPEEFVAKDLRTCILGAIACEAVRQPERGEHYRRYAHLMSEALEKSVRSSPAEAATTQGFLHAVKGLGLYAHKDFDQAIDLCLEGLKSLPQNEVMAKCVLNLLLGLAYWGNGDLDAAYSHCEECRRLCRLVDYSYGIMQATTALAHIRFARGHLHSAAAACNEAIQLGTDIEGKESPVACYAHLLLGEILYQWNTLDKAKDNVMKAIRLSAEHPEPVIHLNGQMALARIAVAEGKSDVAMEIALRAKIAYERASGRLFPADAFITRLWLMAGNVSAASDHAHVWSRFLWLGSGDLAKKNRPSDCIKRGVYGTDIRDIWSEIPLLTLVRLRLAQRTLDGMHELLDDICQNVESKGWTNILVEALILKALTLNAEGKLARALRTLENVLSITEKEGYIRVFVDEGMPMYLLLHRAASRGIAPLYVSKLLDGFNIPDSRAPDRSEKSKVKASHSSWQTTVHAHMAEPLTRREIEVLELVAAGLPNRDIADKLAITLRTVKNHLHSIYEKLDVNSRARAIIRAQEIGLLKSLPTCLALCSPGTTSA